MGRMPHNLKTLKHLMQQNAADFEILQSKTSGSRQREAAAERMKIRRRKMATLCEELSLRTQRLQPIMKRMHQIAERFEELDKQLNSTRHHHARPNDRQLAEREREELVQMCLESPKEFRARSKEIRRRFDGWTR